MQATTSGMVGKKVQLFADGSNCNIDYDKCIGMVVKEDFFWVQVQISEGFNRGATIGFKIGGENFRMVEIPDEWDL